MSGVNYVFFSSGWHCTDTKHNVVWHLSSNCDLSVKELVVITSEKMSRGSTLSL